MVRLSNLYFKYAKRLGCERIEEITNWRNYYKNSHKLGVYAEINEKESFGLKLSIEREIISKEHKLRGFPLSIGCGDQRVRFPYLEKDKLFYIVEDSYGELDLSKKTNYFKDKRYKKVIEYSKSDLPNMLKGCYKLFSRVVANMFFIMDDFNKKNA